MAPPATATSTAVVDVSDTRERAEHWSIASRSSRSAETSAEHKPTSFERSAARVSAEPTSAEETIARLPEGDLQAAIEAARAGRELARMVSDEERERLVEEHRSLSQKVFRGGLTAREQRRLQYVRWSLDRIEDADNGAHLDRLRAVVEIQERIASRVDAFAGHVREVLRDKSRRR